MRSFVDVRLVFYVRQNGLQSDGSWQAGNGWIAESEGLRLSATGVSPEQAIDNLKREIHDKINQPFYYASYEDANRVECKSL